MSAILLVALLGTGMLALVAGGSESDQDDPDPVDETVDPQRPDPVVPAPTTPDPLSPPPTPLAAPLAADLPYNPLPPPLEETSDGIAGQPNSRGDIFITQGTAGDDTIAATDGIVNRIRGLGGDDLLIGGAGDDSISGQDGDDIFITGAGDDFIDMGGGNDLAYLGDGADRNGGYSGNSSGGNDTTYGGAGDDALSDSSGRNLMFGEDGNDRLVSIETTPYVQRLPEDSQFDDTLVGGAGDDSFLASVSDLIFGGAGADDITIADSGGDGPAVIADFDLDEDTLVIEYDNRPGFAAPYTERPEVSFEYDPRRAGASVSFNGAERVFLYNIEENAMAELRSTTRIVAMTDR